MSAVAGRVGAQARNATRTGALLRERGRNIPENARHIKLQGVPSSITPSDIRRAISKKLLGVADVSIDYRGFKPSGDAFITLTRPEYMRDNLRELDNFTLLGLPVKAFPQVIDDDRTPRSRGEKGREEAVARGSIIGDGLKGNFPNTERNVVIWGLPGRLDVQALGKSLSDFKLSKPPKGRGQTTIVKVPMPDNEFSMYSRFMVTMASVSEAHRLVRRLHLKYWDENGRFLVHARVLY